MIIVSLYFKSVTGNIAFVFGLNKSLSARNCEVNIAQNAYCSRDIYFQFNKVRRSVILRAIMQRLYENASAIGCEERTFKLINMLLVAN